MTTNTIDVLIRVIIPMSAYDCLCVSPHTASRVITAPLCGRVSQPPEAIEAIRWRTSGESPTEFAHASQSLDMRSSAIDMPPEAEPVMPARVVTDTASDQSGVTPSLIPRRKAAIDLNPGKAAMTLP